MRALTATLVVVLILGCETSPTGEAPSAPQAVKADARSPFRFKGDIPGKTTLAEVEARDVKWKRYEVRPGVLVLVQQSQETIAGWRGSRVTYTFVDGVLENASVDFSTAGAGHVKRIVTQKWGEPFGTSGEPETELTVWKKGHSKATLLIIDDVATWTVSDERLSDENRRRSEEQTKKAL